MNAPVDFAPGQPGIEPRWTSSSKEGVGTAYHTASRVWFTISHGVLNEVYFPTIDRPQIRDLQFLISDGESFFHEEKRHLQHEIDYIEQHTLGYRIISTDPDGRYRLIKEIVTDPHHPCVLIHVKLDGEPRFLHRLRVYALLAPHLEVGGWGNSARKIRKAGHDLLVAWKGRTYLTLDANVGFTKTSCGFVGVSDGWQDLHDNFQMDWQYERAENGNVAVIGQIDTSGGNEFVVGLAFGESMHAAITTLMQSLRVPFAEHRQKYIEQWHRVCCDITELTEHSHDAGRLYRISRNLLLAHEDKTFAGAFIASASIPWGDTKGDEDLGGYHLVWTRDMVNSVTGLMACGDIVTPCRALAYLACSQRSDGGFPQNFWLDGEPFWSGIQLDEVAFPIILAWRLWKVDALGGFDPYPLVRDAAGFLIRHGPVSQQERWEENSGYSPSTLAATIAALVCAADFVRSRQQENMASYLEEYADFLETHLERWTVTTDGGLLKNVPRHYIRIHPTDINNPVPDEDPNGGALIIRNRAPGTRVEFPAKEIVDAGFLELVRYGIRKAGDSLIENSLCVVDAVLKVETPFGPCWHRYNHDGYGTRTDGGPFQGWGKGRAWPLLTGERAHYELAAGRDVSRYVRAMEAFASKGGMLPEQIWDEPDKPEAGMYFGRPAGSAMPLMWAHAEYIKLLRSCADGQPFDRIPIVEDRYLSGRKRKDLEVWKPNRQLRRMPAGQLLRIQAPSSFRLRWTKDDRQTFEDTHSTDTGLGIHFVDLKLSKSQCAPISFTFYWLNSKKWESRDYAGQIQANRDEKGTME